MKTKGLWFAGGLGVLLMVFVLTGCVGPGLYSIYMDYDAEADAISDDVKAKPGMAEKIVAVAEFADARDSSGQQIIGHVVEKDGFKSPIFPKHVLAGRAVSGGIKKYLKKVGYRVSEKMESWDLKEENILIGEGGVLIGGRIDRLEIDCRKGFPTNTYESFIKLTVVFADREKGKIFLERQVESRLSQEHMGFSENILSEQASLVLKNAIEKLFEDKNTIRYFQHHLMQSGPLLP